ncbi:MAG: FAD-dependent oxidoreductase [Patescibacteria group bacterium]
MTYDLVIIGADSAGLSAGIYAGRKKMNTVILTKKVGGQSLYTNSIENYPGFLKIAGVDLISKMKEQAENFGVLLREGVEVKSILKKEGSLAVMTDENEYYARTVIVASGSEWKKLDVPGEDEFMGKGVSVCAICDAPFYSGKDVAVVGGGNSAFESAQDLLAYANKIYVLQHSKEFIGDKVMFERLKKEDKIEFLTNAETREIKGSNFVEGLVYEDLNSGKTKELKVGGVFVNVGRLPNTAFLGGFLNLNDYKEVIIDHKTCTTSVPGVFSAGDVTDVKYKQSIIAAASGVTAALSAHEYLSR